MPFNFTNDQEMLAHGMVIYDALYAWCPKRPLKKIGRFPGCK